MSSSSSSNTNFYRDFWASYEIDFNFINFRNEDYFVKRYHPVSEQNLPNCYAHAAVNGYIDVFNRIYRNNIIFRKDKSFDKLLEVASYSNDGGNVAKSVGLINKYFGVDFVHCKNLNKIEPKIVYNTSIILSFKATTENWKDIAKGLCIKPKGNKNYEKDSHAVQIVAYDPFHDFYLCKNSWGKNNIDGYFVLNLNAVHVNRYYQIYYYVNDLQPYKLGYGINVRKTKLTLNVTYNDKTVSELSNLNQQYEQSDTFGKMMIGTNLLFSSFSEKTTKQVSPIYELTPLGKKYERLYCTFTSMFENYAIKFDDYCFFLKNKERMIKMEIILGDKVVYTVSRFGLCNLL